ncbi:MULTISPECIES: hypothetical protein [unclassified Microcoleus]|nr:MULTISPECIES: hypothetical protein [unclassified Microcoleus]
MKPKAPFISRGKLFIEVCLNSQFSSIAPPLTLDEAKVAKIL